MDKVFILNQAYEESRYYRIFHHTIYVLFMTLYLALLGIQLSSITSISLIKANVVQNFTVVVLLFVLMPLYYCYIISSYHKTIATINSLIAYLASLSNDELGGLLPDSSQQELRKALNLLLFKKYEVIIRGNKNPLFVGRGTWFFVISFGIIVASNMVLFFSI